MSERTIADVALRAVRSGLKAAGRALVSALVAVALVSSTVGCYAYGTSKAPLRVNETTRLEFTQGVPLGSLARAQWKDTTHLRTVTAIEGTLVGVTPESLIVVIKQTFPAESRAKKQIVVVPQSPTTKIQQRQFSQSRTALLVLGIGVVILGILAYGASTMEYDWGSSGSGDGF